MHKIKDFGVFRNFSWQATIPEFKKYNLIYGWNYSGKTTLTVKAKTIGDLLSLRPFTKIHFRPIVERVKQSASLERVLRRCGGYHRSS
ncbi:MAG: AAA family ATPase [Candidatus Kuenenia sp.]|nr:AAA family ATPase [Candidatus Kuenenia hertensis]